VKPRSRLRRRAALCAFALAACVAEGMSVAVLAASGRADRVFASLALHFLAAPLCLSAARRRHPAASQVERDTVVLTAIFVPVFGPVLAWAYPRVPKEEAATNAHEMFERYEGHVRPRIPEYERTLFTGDHDRDLARELDAESYYEVLRHGKTDQKRNALRRLADLGERKHLELIRRCLRDPEHEVRLYAYAELERLGQLHDSRIAKAGRDRAAQPQIPAAPTALADAHLAYAQSGVLDEGMAAYHYQAAIRNAQAAIELGDAEPDAPLIAALAHGELGRHAEAMAALDQVHEAHRSLPKARIVRARLAFRRRDFTAARDEAVALSTAGDAMPDWLKSLLPRINAGTEPGQEAALGTEVPPTPAPPSIEEAPAAVPPEPEGGVPETLPDSSDAASAAMAPPASPDDTTATEPGAPEPGPMDAGSRPGSIPAIGPAETETKSEAWETGGDK